VTDGSRASVRISVILRARRCFAVLRLRRLEGISGTITNPRSRSCARAASAELASIVFQAAPGERGSLETARQIAERPRGRYERDPRRHSSALVIRGSSYSPTPHRRTSKVRRQQLRAPRAELRHARIELNSDQAARHTRPGRRSRTGAARLWGLGGHRTAHRKRAAREQIWTFPESSLAPSGPDGQARTPSDCVRATSPSPHCMSVESPMSKILIADNNRDPADSLAMLLEMDGPEVTVVSDGSSALRAIANGFWMSSCWASKCPGPGLPNHLQTGG
jgi:hypothetical protein